MYSVCCTLRIHSAVNVMYYVMYLQFDTSLISSQSEPLRIVTLKLGMIITLLSVTADMLLFVM